MCVAGSLVNQLDNTKPVRTFYIFKHVLNINLVLIIRKCKIIISQTFESVRSNTQSLGSQLRL